MLRCSNNLRVGGGVGPHYQKEIAMRIRVLLCIIAVVIVGGMVFYAMQTDDSKHRETRILASVATGVALLGAILSAWSSITVSEKSMSASVRPFIRVSIEEKRYPNNPCEYHQICAENIGNGAAHGLEFELKSTDTDYNDRLQFSSLAVNQKAVIKTMIFWPDDRENQIKHCGSFIGLGNLTIKICGKDILDDKHNWKQNWEYP